MKNFLNSMVGSVLLSIPFITGTLQHARAQDVEVSYGAQSPQISYQSFYDQLAPYGQWISDPYYGNVFVPNVPPGFRPYATDGYWAMTDQGNMWMSDEPWAWACYHYGRWTYNSYYGWLWIPGYQWAPAWVSWRSGGGYYGWAPMGPGYSPGGVYNYPDNYWVFVTPQYLYEPHVYEYYGHESPGVYISRTSYLNETSGGGSASYYYGPRAGTIEREVHHPVQVYHVGNAAQPGVAQVGGGNTLNIYHPSVNQASAASARPANVMPAENHPIGRTPEAVAPNHQTTMPAFHQQMQNQNPGMNNGGQIRNQPQPQQQRQPQEPARQYQQPQPQAAPQRQYQQPQPQAQPQAPARQYQQPQAPKQPAQPQPTQNQQPVRPPSQQQRPAQRQPKAQQAPKKN